MEVQIPFKAIFQYRMAEGLKFCTSRTKKYGICGDYFRAFSCNFKIVEVEYLKLKIVSAYLYHAEGFDSPEQFEMEWCRIHPRAGWVSEQRVWVHFFHRI